jgi:hypothetical protein
MDSYRHTHTIVHTHASDAWDYCLNLGVILGEKKNSSTEWMPMDTWSKSTLGVNGSLHI